MFRMIKGLWGAFFMFMIFMLVCGYIANVVKFAKCDFEAPYKTEVLRGAGVFPVVPMGAVLGWMDIKD